MSTLAWVDFTILPRQIFGLAGCWDRVSTLCYSCELFSLFLFHFELDSWDLYSWKYYGDLITHGQTLSLDVSDCNGIILNLVSVLRVSWFMFLLNNEDTYTLNGGCCFCFFSFRFVVVGFFWSKDNMQNLLCW